MQTIPSRAWPIGLAFVVLIIVAGLYAAGQASQVLAALRPG